MTAVLKRSPFATPKSRAAQAQNDVDDWNRKYPPGTEVTLRKDDGSTVDTRTTTNAQLLGGHSPVVWLFGFSGCWALHRVKAIAS